MTKLGKEYERIVAEIVQQLDPDAKTEIGPWIHGPDGSREIDILITYSHGEEERKFILECKDYQRKRRIGIEVVDAFASKLDDLGAAGALCSNADFTTPARKKAQRLSIGLIGVFSSSEGTTDYQIEETFEWRQVKADTRNITCHFSSPVDLDSSDFSNLFTPSGNSLYELGTDLLNWGLMKYPVVSGTVQFRYGFHDPIIVTGKGDLHLAGIETSCLINGAWFRKKCQITMEKGVYNWITRRSLGPYPTYSVGYHDIEFDKPEFWVPKPVILDTPLEPRNTNNEKNGMKIHFMMLDGVPKPPVSELSPENITLLGNIENHLRSVPKKEFIEKVMTTES